MKTEYFDLKRVEEHHYNVIKLGETPYEDMGYSGGKTFKDIESIIYFIKSDNYYKTFIEKITHLVFTINKDHVFANGNKRTSIALGAFFLKINGYEYCVEKFIFDMENISVSVADNKIDKLLLYQIIESIIYEGDYNEELKLEILKAIEYKNSFNDL